MDKTLNAELPYASLHYEEPIVYITFKGSAELGFPEIRELTARAEKLSGHKPYLVLSDITGAESVGITREGQKFSYNAKNAPLNKATAVLVKSFLMKTATNLYVNLGKPEFPYKAFSERQEAIEWLMNIKM